MTTAEGIVWTKDSTGVWKKVIDNWPIGRRSAQIVADDGLPFGKYNKSAAVALIEDAIAKNQLYPSRYQLAVVPGKEMSPEDKQNLADYNERKKVERGEGGDAGLVESYISEEQ
jgi:hypothetical protein